MLKNHNSLYTGQLFPYTVLVIGVSSMLLWQVCVDFSDLQLWKLASWGLYTWLVPDRMSSLRSIFQEDRNNQIIRIPSRIPNHTRLTRSCVLFHIITLKIILQHFLHLTTRFNNSTRITLFCCKKEKKKMGEKLSIKSRCGAYFLHPILVSNLFLESHYASGNRKNETL